MNSILLVCRPHSNLLISNSLACLTISCLPHHVDDEHQRDEQVGHSKDTDQSTESKCNGGPRQSRQGKCQVVDEKLFNVYFQTLKTVEEH